MKQYVLALGSTVMARRNDFVNAVKRVSIEGEGVIALWFLLPLPH
jgi:hypothetical protein